MANVERVAAGLEAIHYHGPEAGFQHRITTTTTTAAPFDLPPQLQLQPADHQDARLPSGPLQSPPSPWLLTAFSDFSDINLTSSPFTRPSAPHPSATAAPTFAHPLLHLPQSAADDDSGSPPPPAASHFFLHEAESIFSSPPPLGLGDDYALSDLLGQPPEPPAPSHSAADANHDHSQANGQAALLPPFMPPRPEPRPRSSRLREGSTGRALLATLSPADPPGSPPGLVKFDPRRSCTPAPPTTAGDHPAAGSSAMPVTTRKRSAAAAAAAAAASASTASSSSVSASTAASTSLSTTSASSRPAVSEPSQRRAAKRPRTTTTTTTMRQPPAASARQSNTELGYFLEEFSDPFGSDSLFGDVPPEEQAIAPEAAKTPKTEEDAVEVIDLVDADAAPPPPKPKSENQIKLGSLQCSICMDDMSDLTATHCGHLFCGVCLHGALHANAAKTVCPICRQKIEVRPSGTVHPKSSSKGYWPLQLKIMTATRKGKRKEGEPAR